MTLVQMVIDAFYKYRHHNPHLIEIFDEAIKQEEQQIKDAYNQGFRDGAADAASYPNISDFNDVAVYENAQNYYNETFNK